MQTREHDHNKVAWLADGGGELSWPVSGLVTSAGAATSRRAWRNRVSAKLDYAHLK